MIRSAPLRTRGIRARTVAASVWGACVVAALSACSTLDDADYAKSTRQLLASQHIDPDASTRNGSRVSPTEGRTVRESIEVHVESFRTPPTSAVQGVGTLGSK